MKVMAELDLDLTFTGADWQETVAEIVKQEIANEVKAAVRKEIRSSKVLASLVKKSIEDQIRKP